MPVPIRCLPDYFHNQGGDPKPSIDYSFLFDQMQNSPKRSIIASNHDASILYEIWLNGEKIGDHKYRIADVVANKTITSRDVMSLKARGFVTGGPEEIEFTQKGRSIITTMALGESNAFLKSKKVKNYSEILASMNKRGKKGYRIASTGQGSPKYRADNSNSIDLRKI